MHNIENTRLELTTKIHVSPAHRTNHSSCQHPNACKLLTTVSRYTPFAVSIFAAPQASSPRTPISRQDRRYSRRSLKA